ncbi:hypothetical protein niasHT_001463 [Heterodera trifolii]|uniref:Pyridoxal phosphate homeostasis protein n=1 Tax=Heterodera trifolii TaxID=157864 RepID=A0ABD2M564_9BILA
MASEFVLNNLRTVLDSVAELCAHSSTSAVRLVAVSKTFPVDSVLLCYRHGGQRHFGENYVQELETKAQQMAAHGADQIRWHYIGRIQSNMGKKPKKFRSQFLVNTSGEPNKGGVRPDELLPLAKNVMEQCHSLTLIGLMTIGSIGQSLGSGDENADFALLRKLRNALQMELRLSTELELSMGMSADYQLAIKYGSTNVRVEFRLKQCCRTVRPFISSSAFGCRFKDFPSRLGVALLSTWRTTPFWRELRARIGDKSSANGCTWGRPNSMALHWPNTIEHVVRSNPLSGSDCSSGSASVDMGNTRVMCTVNGPSELQQQSVSSSADVAAFMEEGVLCVTLRGCDIDASLRYSVERALQAAVCLRKLARVFTNRMEFKRPKFSNKSF